MTGQSSCVACPSGNFCPVAALSSPTPCAAGTYQPNTASVACLPCPPGDFCAAGSATPADPLRLRYFANLASGVSTINITNTGQLGADSPAIESAAAVGAVCVNVYTFAPDQQLISCCSCPITPNGIVSLDVKKDLATNTLTPATETSLVVKLLTSLPQPGPNGPTCNNSASAPGALASGVEAWATTLHAAPAGGTFQATETPFTRATLSASELAKMTGFCSLIQADGSGFGICNSCTPGAFGAAKQ
jgi:hypothetical protein